MSGDARPQPNAGLIRRRSVLQFATASMIPCAACTLVDDAVMRPGLINARNIHNIAWSGDGNRIAGSDAPRSFVAVWDAHSGANIWRHDLPTATASGPLGFVDRSTLLALTDPNSVISPGHFTPLLDPSSGGLQTDLNTVAAGRLPNTVATCLAPSNDERFLAIAFRKQPFIDVVQFGEGVEVTRIGPIVDGLGRTGSTISFICMSPDNGLVAIGFTWGEAQVWDIGRNLCLARLAVYENMSLRGLAFVDATTLVTCSDGIRSVPTHQIIKVAGYRWAPVGMDLAQATIRVWDVASGNYIRSLQTVDGSGTESITATPHGALVACVSRTKHLHVWRAADGVLVRSLQLPFVSALDPQGDARFSHDGTRIAATAGSSVFVEPLV